MEFVIILLKSLLIGGLLGFAAGAGAALAPVFPGLAAPVVRRCRSAHRLQAGGHGVCPDGSDRRESGSHRPGARYRLPPRRAGQ